jgi:hypothetical protein
VEILECELGEKELIGVVECVNRYSWKDMVRLVILDIFLLAEAIRLIINNYHLDKSESSTFPIIDALDELVSSFFSFLFSFSCYCAGLDSIDEKYQ